MREGFCINGVTSCYYYGLWVYYGFCCSVLARTTSESAHSKGVLDEFG